MEDIAARVNFASKQNIMGRRREFPNTYVIIAALTLICAAASWFVPGGEPQTWQIFSALYEGFIKQSGIIAFILIIGGTFWLIGRSHAIDAGIFSFLRLCRRMEQHRWVRRIGVGNIVIVFTSLLFSTFGAVFGMSEETIPFAAVLIPLAIAMGYDSIVGVCMVYVAAHVGFAGAFLNPFTIGIAQGMADLPLFSGMGYRILCWLVLNAVMLAFVLLYASRIKKHPEKSPVRELDAYWRDRQVSEEMTVETQHIVILSLLGLTVAGIIVGVTCFDWYLPQLSALFLLLAILTGITMKLSANEIATQFIAGAKDIFSAALVVGLAGGIVTILENGRVMEPMLDSLAGLLEGSGKAAALSLMYGIQTLINLAIPSASAKAAMTIPIMAPFADMIDLSRQSMVLAFQFGDGFTNMITPTSGVLVAVLGMARIPYAKWLKFIWKFILALVVLGFVLLLPTVFANIAGF